MVNFTKYAIPQHTADALNRYIIHRTVPGGFLYAVLAGDLFQAVGKADDENFSALANICLAITNELPVESYGSYIRVEDYIKQKDYNEHF